MVREICVVQLNDRKRSWDLMLSLNETVDELAMTSIVVGVVMC